jgi:hypothetical protein
MAGPTKVPSSSTTLLSNLVLMFAYLFPCKMGTNVCVEIWGNKNFFALVECLDSSFSKDRCVVMCSVMTYGVVRM